MNWLAHINILLAAKRHGSATRAGQVLGMSTATVIRRLESLEEDLKARLFDRTSSGLKPTKALELVLPWAEQIEAASDALMREVKGLETTPTGLVRISLLETISRWIVAPQMHRLFAAYPGLEVSLLPEARLVDLTKGEADIVLRTSRPSTGDLVSQRVGAFPMIVVASPELLDKIQPKSLGDLPWIDWDVETARTPDVQWLETHVPEAQIVLRSSSVATMLHAAQTGVGAMIVAGPLAAAVGGVQQVPLPTAALPEVVLYLIAHRAQRPIPRIVAVWEFLVEIFGETMNELPSMR